MTPSTTHAAAGGRRPARGRAPGVRAWRAALVAAASCACAPALRDPPQPPRTQLDGLTYSEFVGTTLVRRTEAEQVIVVPKQFGGLQISALSDVLVSGARIQLFEPVAEDGPLERAGLDAVVPADGFAVPGLTGLRLGGATFHGLEVVLLRGGAPVARVAATLANSERRSGNVVLREFELEHLPTQRVIRGPRATWRRQTRDFVIAGDYVVAEGGTTRPGRGLLVDRDFNLRPP